MKQFNKWKVWAVPILLLVLLATGLFYYGTMPEGEKKEIVLIIKIIDSSNDFWSSLVQGAQMAAKEYDVELTVMGPEAETEYEIQGSMIREAVERKPDAIILAPSNYTETVEYARMIEDAGIPLILVDSLMEEEMGECVVATDNVEAGRKMGEYIAENYPEDITIGVVSHVQGSSTATEREKGLKKGLKGLKEQIVDTVYCDSDYEKSYEVTKEMLERYPQINVIAGMNEYSAVGAARAVRDLNLTEKIRMIGFDSSLEEVSYLEDGTFDAIVMQKPLNMGYLCVEKTVQLLNKEKLSDNVDSGSVLITKDTMYSEENQKLLFPF